MNTPRLSLLFLAIACLLSLVAAFVTHSAPLEIFGVTGLAACLWLLFSPADSMTTNSAKPAQPADL